LQCVRIADVSLVNKSSQCVAGIFCTKQTPYCVTALIQYLTSTVERLENELSAVTAKLDSPTTVSTQCNYPSIAGARLVVYVVQLVSVSLNAMP